MMGDPRATFYYPHELARIWRAGFVVGLIAGTLVEAIVVFFWLI